MKKVGKWLLNLGIGVWVVVALFVTICLLSYNEFNIPVFGKTTLLIVDNEELEPDYGDGDLLVVKRDSDKKVEIGDTVFFYNGNKSNEYLINTGTVTGKHNVTATETTYEINNQKVSGGYVIGKTSSTQKMKNMGLILGIFTSQWGYMFLVIFPTLFAIIYEVMMIIEASKTLKLETDRKFEKVSVDA